MKSKILAIANAKHTSSGGMCGTYFPDILKELEVSAAEFEVMIAEMYNNEEIDIRQGINGFMVMLKTIKN